MNNKNRLLYLFFKVRSALLKSGKFHFLSDKIAEQIKESYFFNQDKVICLYNHYDSVIINSILRDETSYFKNTFVFPKLEGNNVSFYHIPDPSYLIFDEFGIKDVVSGCFKIDISEIDVILVSGTAFDNDGNRLNTSNNEYLYNVLLNKTDAVKFGVCFDYQIYRKGLPESEQKIDCFLTEEGVYTTVDI
jgi:5-formyltetrahydrofolate cyclo-ligase